MKNKNEQYKIITNTLVKTGAFSISDIENKGALSRESIGKILRKLVNDNLLKKTAQKGSGVKYKLGINNEALAFFFEYVEQATIDDLARAWNISVGSAKKYIKKFIDAGFISKLGAPPQKIIYTYILQKDESHFSSEQRDVIEKYYKYTTPEGRLLEGIKGFVYWAENKSGRNDIKNLAREYIDTRKKYYNNQSEVIMIDATDKLQNVFEGEVYIEKLFHRDYDALPVFGKTALSQMVRTAKSGRKNRALMKKIVEKMQESVDIIISQYNITCAGFIPPTVARKTQLMTFIARQLRIPCKKIFFQKVKSLAPVQQKSLKKIEDRILNAQKTIIVSDAQKYKNILLIDDVTGSGATLNETAKKIIAQGIAQKVYAFTITGSAKAGVFDIISEA
jgi:predicted transcriptional regulator/adenine/guanine phosphoribosyltransferase-like PRPP-binding protein